MIRKPFELKHLPKTALILLMVVVFARLGVWQLDRLAQRRAANERLLAQIEGETVDLNTVSAEIDPTPLIDRNAIARGTFDFDYQVGVTQQRLDDGRSGIYLVAPLVLENNQAVLVNRGFLPQNEVAPDNWPAFDVAGAITVEGAILAGERLPSRELSDIAPGQQEVFRIDIAALDRVTPYELLPVYLLQTTALTDDLPITLTHDVDLSEGSHLSYAIQWFAFAGMAVIFYIYYLRRYG